MLFNQLLLTELCASGLDREDHFELWKELRFEQAQAKRAAHETLSPARLDLIVPFIRILPIARNVVHAIEREFLESNIADTEIHPALYSDADRRALQRKLARAPTDRLVTLYRTRRNVARQVERAFCGLTQEHFARDLAPLSCGPMREQTSSFEGSIPLAFYCLSDGLAEALQGDERVLAKLYRDDTHLRGLVPINRRALTDPREEHWRQALNTIETLGGQVRETRPQILRRFGGEFPLLPAEERLHRSGESLGIRAEIFGFRIPCGALEHTRHQLEQAQTDLERGEISAYQMILHGRIDRKFLDWLSGTHLDSHDPIPGVEVCYALPLPSGRTYTLVLKAARSNGHGSRHNPLDFDAEDRRVIEALTKYFSLAAHKKNPDLFTTFRESDYAGDLKPYLANPVKIDSLSVYRALRAAWNISLINQILGGEAEYREAFQVLLPSQEISDVDEFTALVERRLSRLPFEQQAQQAEQFLLSGDERARFLLEYAPQAHALVRAEASRFAAEAPEVQRSRRELGYFGPPCGYRLPLDHMLMDMIIDLRKRDRFRARAAEEKQVPIDSVVVPPQIGRSYRDRTDIYRLEELPDLLETLSKDKRFPRDLKLRVHDPRAEQPYREYPVEATKRVLREIAAENRRRFQEAEHAYRESFRERQANSEVTEIELTTRAVFLQLWEGCQKSIDRFTGELSQLAEEQRIASYRLNQELTTLNAPKDERTRRFGDLKDDFQRREKGLSNALSDAYMRGEFLWHTFMPSICRSSAIRGHSIIDTRTIKFIYSIGHDGQVLISPVQSTSKGDFRKTHSQQLAGGAMYAGGELVLFQHDRIFHNYADWQAFDRELSKRPQLPWKAREINNSTGHYRIFSNTLRYASRVIFPKLEALGISTERCDEVDRLLPGLRVRGAVGYWSTNTRA